MKEYQIRYERTIIERATILAENEQDMNNKLNEYNVEEAYEDGGIEMHMDTIEIISVTDV